MTSLEQESLLRRQEDKKLMKELEVLRDATYSAFELLTKRVEWLEEESKKSRRRILELEIKVSHVKQKLRNCEK